MLLNSTPIEEQKQKHCSIGRKIKENNNLYKYIELETPCYRPLCLIFFFFIKQYDNILHSAN